MFGGFDGVVERLEHCSGHETDLRRNGGSSCERLQREGEEAVVGEVVFGGAVGVEAQRLGGHSVLYEDVVAVGQRRWHRAHLGDAHRSCPELHGWFSSTIQA